MIGIYGLRCKETDKWYIGQSWDIYNRWSDYQKFRNCKKQPKLYRALLKYGYNRFEKYIIELCDENIPQEMLDLKEDLWIKHHNSIEHGYNCKGGGHGGKGKKWSNEQKIVISQATHLAQSSKEYRDKISKSWIKRRLVGVTDETRGKHRKYALNQSIETRNKISKSNKGKIHTEETKNKIREARLRYWEEKRLTKSILCV